MPNTRIRIERAIWQERTGGDFLVVSYSKEKKNATTLARFKELRDAQVYRDENLRFAKYGKGIQKLKTGRYTAQIICPPSKYKTNDTKPITGHVYIGMFDTPDEARAARLAYIESLK